ncbi:MAG: ATP-binding protein [Pseudomonadota bacterium]
MRRLYMQFYFSILITIAVFMCAVGAFWHLSTPPRSDVWGVEGASELARLLLPPEVDAARDERVLNTLSKQFDSDVSLFGAAGQPLVIVGRPPTLPRDAWPKNSGWSFVHGGPQWILRLDDGRALLVRPRHFPRHGPGITLVLVAIGLAFALGAYPIARRLTRRVERLQRGVEQLGAGNLGTRVAVEGRDEVAALARSFNTSAARIETLVETQKQLLANCSHELRTPLARIRMAIERMTTNPSAALRDELARSIAELDGLIDELLLMSRLNALSAPERAEPVDLLALAAEESAYFNVTAAGAPVIVQGDARLLRRMLRNLLANAAQHAGGATRVEVSADTGGARLLVEDRGPGIPAAERERIFEPFFRSSGASGEAATAGSGLGLSIVRQVARAHGGDVQHSDLDGGGSRFVVTLRC